MAGVADAVKLASPVFEARGDLIASGWEVGAEPRLVGEEAGAGSAGSVVGACSQGVAQPLRTRVMALMYAGRELI